MRSRLKKALRRWAVAASAFAVTATGLVGVTAAPAHAATSMDLAYVADYSNDVRVLDMATGVIVGSIPLGDRPRLVVASPDKRSVYALRESLVANNDDAILVIDTATDTVTRTVGVCRRPMAATMKPNSTELWISCYSGDISVFDTVTETVTRTIDTGVPDLGIRLLFNADGSIAYSTFDADVYHYSNGVVAINTTTGAATTVVVVDNTLDTELLLSPDASTILVSHWNSQTLEVIDTASDTVTSTIPMGGGPREGVLNPAGTAAYYCVDETHLAVVDLASRSIVRTMTTPCQGSPTFAPDQNTLYVVSYQGLSVVDIRTGTVTATTRLGSTLEAPTGSIAFVQTALAPTVAAVSPAQGIGGAKVVITGGPFIGGGSVTAVTFGGVPAAEFTVDSETQITATVPAQSVRTVDVTVTDDNGTSAVAPSDRYTYVLPPPTISSLSPNSGVSSGGTTVVITGTDFATAKSVYFGGTAASSFTVDSDTQITAVTRAQHNGTVPVTVTNSAGVSTAVQDFTFFSPVPAVTGLSPSSGTSAGGTTVTITGIRFTGTFRVMFGGVAVPYTLNSDSQITVVAPAWSSLMTPASGTTPPGSVGVVDVQVTTDVDTSVTSSADYYDYLAGA
ncbi:MAG: hypothetical protein HOV87_04445 [Catenulispora sp.]|nr:hypothetical protein [Catenulispora sp.]